MSVPRPGQWLLRYYLMDFLTMRLVTMVLGKIVIEKLKNDYILGDREEKGGWQLNQGLCEVSKLVTCCG